MVFQSFSSKVYRSGIKVSTKIRFLLSSEFFNKASLQLNDVRTEKAMSATYSGLVTFVYAMIYYIICKTVP